MPLNIELVGLAGSGKSTLLHELLKNSRKVAEGERLRLKNPRYYPLYLRHAVTLLPFIRDQSRFSRRPNKQELKDILYLNCWNHVIQRQSRTQDISIVIDQGAVFKLATLHGFGPAQIYNKRYQHWWQSAFNRWASTMNVIIWLDAPSDVLLQRINNRKKFHTLKNNELSESVNYLSTYNTSLEFVASKLQESGNLHMIRLDSSRYSIEQIAKLALDNIENISHFGKQNSP